MMVLWSCALLELLLYAEPAASVRLRYGVAAGDLQPANAKVSPSRPASASEIPSRTVGSLLSFRARDEDPHSEGWGLAKRNRQAMNQATFASHSGRVQAPDPTANSALIEKAGCVHVQMGRGQVGCVDPAKTKCSLSLDQDGAACFHVSGHEEEALIQLASHTAHAGHAAHAAGNVPAAQQVQIPAFLQLPSPPSSACPRGCSGHGRCDERGGTCWCDAGFGGVHCQVAQGLCLEPATKVQVQCGSHGRCSRGACVCSDGYTGVHCQLRPCPRSCSQKGFCYHTPDGEPKCICQWGSYGDDCSLAGCSGGCGANGVCHEDAGTGRLSCLCGIGWAGPNCKDRACPPCGPHGRCERSATSGEFSCLCLEGWSGPLCEDKSCPNGCSMHGQCLPEGKCLCEAPWTGASCAIDSRVCPNECSGHGKCVDWGCWCDAPYVGKACDVIPCKLPCANGGICQQGHCWCPSPFTGKQCTQRLCPNQCSGRGTCDYSTGTCVCDGPLSVARGTGREGEGGGASGVVQQGYHRGYFGADCSLLRCASDCGAAEEPPRGECDSLTGRCRCFDGSPHDRCGKPLCDRSCSGHGVCVDGACLCDRGDGLDGGYTGADCEAPLCPGRCSADLPSGPQGQCTEQGCRCSEGFFGEDCSRAECPRSQRHAPLVAVSPGAAGAALLLAPANGASTFHRMCGGNGLCLAGKCACRQGWGGAACDIRRCPEDCSQRGVCLDGGACLCDAGYGGLGCEQETPLLASILRNQEQHQCSGGCSGRGLCLHGKCLCERGKYHGPACEKMFCPDDCSDRGLCDAATGQCKCFDGFKGPACQDLWCVPADCSQHGVCQAGPRGAPPKCVCHPPYTGTACADVQCSDDRCSGHGKCLNDVCFCEPGWKGQSCETEKCPHKCSGHGRCVALDIVKRGLEFPTGLQLPKQGQRPPEEGCLCDAGWSGRACDSGVCHPSPTCSGNGKCVRRGTGPLESAGKQPLLPSKPVCVCNEPFGGPACDQIKCKDTCSGHGGCYGGQCHCQPGYSGEHCERDVCPEKCNGRGRCNSLRDPLAFEGSEEGCVCDEGYSGEACEKTPACDACVHGACFSGQCACDPGWSGTFCNSSLCLPSPNCTGHGQCGGDAFGRPTCFCLHPWGGEDCGQLLCPFDCHGHGRCDRVRGRCVCEEGRMGDECEYLIDEVCPSSCGGHGRCISPREPLAYVTPRTAGCLCDEGWTGSDCSTQVPCPAGCQAHGVCNAGTCACDAGWDGVACEVSLCQPGDCGGTHRGVCGGDAFGNPVCRCSFPFTGAACDRVSCAFNCNLHGRCEDFQCKCEPGWMGELCDTPVCPNHCHGFVPGNPTPSPVARGAGAGSFVEKGRCNSPQLPASYNKDLPEGCLCAAGWGGEDCSVPVCNADTAEPLWRPPVAALEAQAQVAAATYNSSAADAAPHPLLLLPLWQGCSARGNCTEASAIGQPHICDCLPPFTGPACAQVSCSSNCSGHGACVDGGCHCQEGYYGIICHLEACPGNCTGRGTCVLPRPDQMTSGDSALQRWGPLGHRDLPSNLSLGAASPPLERERAKYAELDFFGCLCDVGFQGYACDQDVPCEAACGPHGTCQQGSCACDAGWAGPQCMDSLCDPPDCSGHGVCGGDAFGRPVCHCDYPYLGRACQDLSCSFDCSGHGQCRDFQCVCEANWSGNLRKHPNGTAFTAAFPEGCLCSKGWSGPGCTEPDCGPSCSLHGHCVVGKDRGGHDRPVCACDKPFTGPNCTSLLCTKPCGGKGRGKCVDFKCQCEDGWQGPECEEPVCSPPCANGGRCRLVPANITTITSPQPPSLQDLKKASRLARGRLAVRLAKRAKLGGQRVHAVSQQVELVPTCECGASFEGAGCQNLLCTRSCSGHGHCINDECWCDADYTGQDCELEVCPGHCGGNGRCNNPLFPWSFDSSSPAGCHCFPGWGGAGCTVPVCDPPCHNGGACQALQISLLDRPTLERVFAVLNLTSPFQAPLEGSASALEILGGDEADRAAAEASSMAHLLQENAQLMRLVQELNRSHPECVCVEGKGFGGPTCSEPTCESACSGHGQCYSGRCHCWKGWEGLDCERESCPMGCSGHGRCNRLTSLTANATGEVYDATRPDGCICDKGWVGAACDTRGGCSAQCLLHGVCVEGVCACGAGWSGLDCDVSLCDPPDCGGRGVCAEDAFKRPVCQCKPPYVRLDNETACAHTACGLQCGQHGRCLDGRCVCQAGWTGVACEKDLCPGQCSGHGVCNSPRHGWSFDEAKEPGCQCTEGWAGEACDKPTCSPECSPRRGACVEDARGRHYCECAPGFTGKDCSAQGCHDSCSVNGVCMEGVCHCDKGKAGVACQFELCPGKCGGPTRGRCSGAWPDPPPKVAPGAANDRDPKTAGVPLLAVQTSPPTPPLAHARSSSGDASLFVGQRLGGLTVSSSGCMCRKGWTGPDCNTPACDPPCMNDGVCVVATLLDQRPVEGALPAGAAGAVGGLAAHASGAKVTLMTEMRGRPAPPGDREALESSEHVCSCPSPYAGLACQLLGCSNDCSGHGVCIGGKCQCELGWKGEDCAAELCPKACGKTPGSPSGPSGKSTQASQAASQAANLFAESSRLDNSQERGFCNHPASSRFTADQPLGCVCSAGFAGEDCMTYLGCGDQCVEHGECVQTGSRPGDVQCVCDVGWSGPSCQRSLCVPSDCGGNGICSGSPDGKVFCKCDDRHTGEKCEIELCEDSCTHHGRCENFQCVCDSGWTGDKCELPQCNPPCVFGSCEPDGTTCKCATGFWGPTCAERVCPDNNCNGHGLCDHSVGVCQCEPGWHGECCHEFSTAWCLQACSKRCAAFKHKGFMPVLDADGNKRYVSHKSCLDMCALKECQTSVRNMGEAFQGTFDPAKVFSFTLPGQ